MIPCSRRRFLGRRVGCHEDRVRIAALKKGQGRGEEVRIARGHDVIVAIEDDDLKVAHDFDGGGNEPAERIVAAVRGVARGEGGWFSRQVAALLAHRLVEALRSRRMQARP